jgi:hypothetical protein
MTTTEPSVEDALKELLTMFPGEHDPTQGKFISVTRQEFIDSNSRRTSRWTKIYIGRGQSPPSCDAPTLSEAMSQVRAWREEQK